MKILSIILIAITLSSCGLFQTKTSSDLENELDRNLYTGSFQPIQPFTFDEKFYSVDIDNNCFVKDLEKRKECWLDNLPNSEDYVSIADTKYKGSLGFGVASVSAEGGNYEIVSQWVRFFNAKPIDAEGATIEGEDHKVGVGARIVARISTSKEGINLADLFAVAAEAENNNVQGSLLFTIQGVHGKGVDTYTPRVSKLDQENLRRALEAMQNIKTLLHNDDSIKLTAQVIAIRKTPQETIVQTSISDDELKAKKAAGIKSQGWVYVGYFNDNGKPNGTTTLNINSISAIKGVLITRTKLNVRTNYPTFPFYTLPQAIDTINSGANVKINKVIETGNNKYWALIEY